MAVCCEHHKKLTNGKGKCSVPMWQMELPAGFCDLENLKEIEHLILEKERIDNGIQKGESRRCDRH